jgi:hypothetical protein
MSKPLNYAKWDNLDSDSEAEDVDGNAAPVPADANPAAFFATPGAQGAIPPDLEILRQQYPEHLSGTEAKAAAARSLAAAPPVNPAGQVLAIRVYCELEKRKNPTPRPWDVVQIPADHPVFRGAPLPVAVRLEVPLVMVREGTRSDERADLDCQIATFLAIDPTSGFAPPRWQSHVGTVIVARQDSACRQCASTMHAAEPASVAPSRETTHIEPPRGVLDVPLRNPRRFR